MKEFRTRKTHAYQVRHRTDDHLIESTDDERLALHLAWANFATVWKWSDILNRYVPASVKEN